MDDFPNIGKQCECCHDGCDCGCLEECPKHRYRVMKPVQPTEEGAGSSGE
jgi:hypothetical protein